MSTPPGGGSATTTAYLWCGDDICQSRDGSNTPIRSFYDEGEYAPGTPAQTLYYGIDQIGSVRRVFASTSSAPAYGYDPYGLPLQATAPITDFVFGGMFFNADSGLYFTKFRAYDPIAGRWLSRDPIGERADITANLYPYVSGNPVSLTDPDGRMVWPLPRPILPGRTDACPKPPSLPGCPPGMSCMTDDQDKPILTSPDIDPNDIAGKTPAEIDKIAKEKGLVPKGPDPMRGKGAYVDPVTGKQRILVHPEGNHAHVNDPSGQRLGPGGGGVAPESPDAHLPLGKP